MSWDRKAYLIRNPLCFRCESVPHMKSDVYCYPCSRIIKNKGEPSCRRRKDLNGICPRCLVNPRGTQPYCPKCKLDYQNEKRAKKWHERYVNNEAKRIETARAYATGLLQRNKIRRGGCVFCGGKGTQFHHYDYELRTRNFEDVCDLCHNHAHIVLKTFVDMFRFGGVRVPSVS